MVVDSLRCKMVFPVTSAPTKSASLYYPVDPPRGVETPTTDAPPDAPRGGPDACRVCKGMGASRTHFCITAFDYERAVREGDKKTLSKVRHDYACFRCNVDIRCPWGCEGEGEQRCTRGQCVSNMENLRSTFERQRYQRGGGSNSF